MLGCLMVPQEEWPCLLSLTLRGCMLRSARPELAPLDLCSLLLDINAEFSSILLCFFQT